MKIFSENEQERKMQIKAIVLISLCLIIGLTLVILGMALNMSSWIIAFGMMFLVWFIMFVPSVIYMIRKKDNGQSNDSTS